MTSSNCRKDRRAWGAWASRGLVGALVAACGPAHGGDPSFWMPYTGGEGGAPPDAGAMTSATGTGGGGGGGGGAPSPGRGLVLQFTTVSLDGEYAPKNVGAVWITDGQGAFVKTLELWAAKRAKHLVQWNAASGGNIVDAVTGATRKTHGAHEASWSGASLAGSPAPEGEYQVHVEFTEWNSSSAGEPPGPSLAIPFSRGPAPQDVQLPDAQGFTAVRLVYEP
ncbi:DUF2271 domain-containing protein [Polyangium aurulentum]|uniref:DUF2271 domain-containing protein n=1 Tax=Polyangium aurulentum TaxID=2567896 RepID=UPI00197D47BB|nr:DUF2271 domain-containing protein [Polyangium aurulentum]UQA56937.1 DUF2271 domain-containing protein [Polyangium aurulentum]